MKVDNQSQIQMQNQTQSTGEKTISQMQPGDKFKATIIDIQPNKVTLELNDGTVLTAKSKVLPEARIGEQSIFETTENFKGQILLSMLKSEGSIPKNFIKEALTNAGLTATDENMSLVNALLENGLPADAETLQKATFFLHSEGDLSIDEILFLLKEDFAANKTTIETLNSIMDRTLRINDSLKNIVDNLFKGNSELTGTIQKDLIYALLNESEANLQLKELMDKAFHKNDPEALKKLKTLVDDKLYIQLKDKDSLKNIESYFKELYSSSENLQEIIEKSSVKTPIANELSNIKDNIEFMNTIKNFKNYMQIPFMIDNAKNQGDLYVFKDGRKKTNFKEQASILLSLNYENLGHIEIYINKLKKDLNFQFKSQDDKVLKIIGANSPKLSDMLLSQGFTISGFALKKSSDDFNVTKELAPKEDSTKERKRFSFDMRV